ncbi:hypothetical protein M0805_004649 [Coniferiporia weirii]|nr:hypothetical protein M0805_004649 [Coniferiporia weirii]
MATRARNRGAAPEAASAPGNRSTLGANHRFPVFYACYLLKSIKTPKSTVTYIGSTPNPPRRLRQHNGELTAGAWKTTRNRPWVMHMIVHGFPSKLSALQFEWAWQHPNRSRHLRDAFDTAEGNAGSGTQGRRVGRPSSLKANIKVVRTIISTHPFITWPLHIKLFTRDAVKFWEAASPALPAKKPKSKQPDLLVNLENLSENMPRGFTASVELDGVDGKSELESGIHSGRGGPIEVTDERFALAHLAKHTALLARTETPTCSICAKPVSTDNMRALEPAPEDQLTFALCPTPTCSGVAHLTCLARYFLQGEAQAHLSSPSLNGSSTLIPRGGECPTCSTYVLWGDVVRGCYRRWAGAKSGGKFVEREEEEEEINDEGMAEEVVSEGEGSPVRRNTEKAKGKSKAGDSEFPSRATRGKSSAASPVKEKPKSRTATRTGVKKRKTAVARRGKSGSEHEVFDMDVSGSETSADERSVPTQTGKATTTRRTTKTQTSKAIKSKGKGAAGIHTAASANSLYPSSSMADSTPLPPWIYAVAPGASPSPAPLLHPVRPSRERPGQPASQGLHRFEDDSGEEFFDLNAIDSVDEESDGAPRAPTYDGRPRKDVKARGGLAPKARPLLEPSRSRVAGKSGHGKRTQATSRLRTEKLGGSGTTTGTRFRNRKQDGELYDLDTVDPYESDDASGASPVALASRTRIVGDRDSSQNQDVAETVPLLSRVDYNDRPPPSGLARSFSSLSLSSPPGAPLADDVIVLSD